MSASAAKLRSLVSRWFGRPNNHPALLDQDAPATYAGPPSAPLFSLGKTRQELVVSFRSGDSPHP